MTLHITKAYKSMNVAKEFIEIATKKQEALTAMQLIKLVYIAHAWMLALYKRPLIKEEVEAWKYGPVIPELYQAIKHYKSQPVVNIKCEDEQIDESALDIITQTYDKYGHLNGIKLSMLTHEENSPWAIAWNNHHSVISNDLITDYYQRLISDE